MKQKTKTNTKYKYSYVNELEIIQNFVSSVVNSATNKLRYKNIKLSVLWLFGRFRKGFSHPNTHHLRSSGSVAGYVLFLFVKGKKK